MKNLKRNQNVKVAVSPTTWALFQVLTNRAGGSPRKLIAAFVNDYVRRASIISPKVRASKKVGV